MHRQTRVFNTWDVLADPPSWLNYCEVVCWAPVTQTPPPRQEKGQLFLLGGEGVSDTNIGQDGAVVCLRSK